MLEGGIPSTRASGPKKEEPIPIDAPPIVGRLFVDLLHHAPLASDLIYFTGMYRAEFYLRDKAFEKHQAVFDLLVKYDCGEGMKERVLSQMKHHVKGEL